MRYLVTGVAGFIGSQVAENLLPRAEELIGVDCFVENYGRDIKEQNLLRLCGAANFRLHDIDLRYADLTDLLAGIDVVVHQAGLPGVRGSWGSGFSDYIDHNVVATQRLLEAARMTKVSSFVYASSSSAYGNAARYPTSEDAIPQPFSPYSVTKLAGEHLCGAYGKNWGVPTVALRYFTVYGPRQRPDMAFHRFIEAALRHTDIQLYGDGEQLRDFTHVDDVVRANVLATEADLPPGTVLNIAGGSHTTVNGVIALLREIAEEPLLVTEVAEQAGDVTETWADCERAERMLGWVPSVGLADGLTTQMDWQRRREEALASERTGVAQVPAVHAQQLQASRQV